MATKAIEASVRLFADDLDLRKTLAQLPALVKQSADKGAQESAAAGKTGGEAYGKEFAAAAGQEIKKAASGAAATTTGAAGKAGATAGKAASATGAAAEVGLVDKAFARLGLSTEKVQSAMGGLGAGLRTLAPA